MQAIPPGSEHESVVPPWSVVLRAVREARGITQEGWAARVGYNARTVRRWERGETAPDAAAEAALVALLREQGLLRSYTSGLLRGHTLTEASLRHLLEEARSGKRSTGDSEPADRSAGVPVSFLRHHPLPISLTSFIGREQELEELARLLARSRLVTLTGPGGTGKTRLALQAASPQTAAYPDGVCFIDLAPLQDPNLVPSAVAQALGVPGLPDVPVRESVLHNLRDKQLLLLLDNYEHLLAAAEFAGALLQAGPAVALLVTSRSPLRIRGEREYAVSPLPLPTQATASAAMLADSPAVALFVARAQDVRTDLVLTDANAGTVAAICSRLDGLPLAIELAAARVRALPLSTLLARLEQRLPLLTGGARDAPARQQTLRDTIAWSYDLLQPADQALFRRLAVFVGGWTLVAAEAVCGGEKPEGVLDGLVRLIDHSLVQQMSSEDAEARFAMLETIREFGLDQLAAADEIAACERQHCAYYCTLAETTEPALAASQSSSVTGHRQWGVDEAALLRQLARDHDNFRQALRWALNHDERATMLRLGAAFWRFWDFHGDYTEGRAWMVQVLAAAPTDAALAYTRVRALQGAGALASQQGDLNQATLLTEESLHLARCIGDIAGSTTALRMLGIQAVSRTELERAHAYLTESLALGRQLDDRSEIASSLVHLGDVARQRQDLAQAQRLVDESLTLFRGLGSRRGLAIALHGKGMVALAQADYVSARAAFAELLAIARAVEDQWALSRALHGFVEVAMLARRWEQAARLLGAFDARRTALQLSRGMAEASTVSRVRAAMRDQMEDARFDAAWTIGVRLPLAAACAEAFALPEELNAIQNAATGATTFTLPDPLTRREIEVLRLIARGQSSREIAATLVISEGTVERHITNLYGKIGARRRADATAYAFQQRLLSEPSS